MEISSSQDPKHWLECYRYHLENVAGLSRHTTRKYLFVIRGFLNVLCPTGLISKDLFTSSAIGEFVRSDAAPRSGNGKRSSVSPIRSFLRFLVSKGVLRTGIQLAVPHIKCRGNGALPQFLAEGESKRIFQANLGTFNEYRNQAILMLLSRFGLRAEEVSQLTIEDIDWANGSIIIHSRKTHCERVLPLPEDVAESLIRYLKFERPASSHRQVFLSPLNPHGPVSSTAISKVAGRLISRAGIRKGRLNSAHLFRHTVATQMVNRGVPFKNVADILGHQSLQTTAVYAKVNLTTLSQVALPWTGAES